MPSLCQHGYKVGTWEVGGLQALNLLGDQKDLPLSIIYSYCLSQLQRWTGLLHQKDRWKGTLLQTEEHHIGKTGRQNHSTGQTAVQESSSRQTDRWRAPLKRLRTLLDGNKDKSSSVDRQPDGKPDLSTPRLHLPCGHSRDFSQRGSPTRRTHSQRSGPHPGGWGLSPSGKRSSLEPGWTSHSSAACIQHQHQPYPRHHHTRCPRHQPLTLPRGLHNGCPHQPGARLGALQEMSTREVTSPPREETSGKGEGWGRADTGGEGVGVLDRSALNYSSWCNIYNVLSIFGNRSEATYGKLSDRRSW